MSASLCQDHPRACGDYLPFFGSCLGHSGSPPRLRGLHATYGENSENVGITPALAGTTLWKLFMSERYRDHPRACGDYQWRTRRNWRCLGSPPRLRGLHPVCTQYIKSIRITPALAGTTSDVNVDVAFPQDHPRACGDYWNSTKLDTHQQGSPPRLRGLP